MVLTYSLRGKSTQRAVPDEPDEPDVTKRGLSGFQKLRKIRVGISPPPRIQKTPIAPQILAQTNRSGKGGRGPVLFVIDWHTIGHTMQHDQCNRLVFMVLRNAVHM